MTLYANIAAILFLCVIITGCSTCLVPEDQQSEAVGVFKSSFFDSSDWQHTATIHGWADDLEICIELVDFLNQKEPGRYICQSL